MAEGAQGVCSARQVGFGLATAVVGLGVTTLVAFRAMKAYRDWVYVVGCAGSVGAGLLVAKFSAAAASVEEQDEQQVQGDPLERALAGSFDAEFASLDGHLGVPGGHSPTTRAGVRAQNLRLNDGYAERTWPGLCELDGWLCDQGLELEQVLEQGPREEVLRIVLDGCPRYCKEKVGLSNLYAQVGWIAGDELKRAVGDYLKVLWGSDDLLLTVMVDLDAASFEWLADQSRPQEVELKRDSSRFEELMLKIYPNWTRSGDMMAFDTRSVYQAWTIIHYPNQAIDVPRATNASLAKVLLEELLPTVADNQWKGKQKRLVGDQKGSLFGARGLWAALELEQQQEVLRATCGSNNYRLLFPLINTLKDELKEPYLEGITQRDEIAWLLCQQEILWTRSVVTRGRTLVEAGLDLAPLIPVLEQDYAKPKAEDFKGTEFEIAFGLFDQPSDIRACAKALGAVVDQKEKDQLEECLEGKLDWISAPAKIVLSKDALGWQMEKFPDKAVFEACLAPQQALANCAWLEARFVGPMPYLAKAWQEADASWHEELQASVVTLCEGGKNPKAVGENLKKFFRKLGSANADSWEQWAQGLTQSWADQLRAAAGFA